MHPNELVDRSKGLSLLQRDLDMTLLMRRDKRVALGRLIRIVAAGERLAAECACRQARLAPSRRATRFLALQGRQEHMHARVFGAAAVLLAAARSDDLAESLFEPFRRMLADDLAAGRFTESLVGMQVVLEALGAVILGELDAALHARGAPLATLRREILRQEHSHHAFGVRWLERLVVSGRARPSAVASAADGYVAAIEGVLDRCRDLAADLDRQPETLTVAFRAALPPWLNRPEQTLGCPL
jgi:1,2-phenylacetyl-CoA epoxidase catalytic subunit